MRSGLGKVCPSVSYTHLDAADDLLCVDLGGRRIIKKKIWWGDLLYLRGRTRLGAQVTEQEIYQS